MELSISASAAAGLSFRDVTFRYASNLPPVLANVSLDVPIGSFVSVVGRSGCGKSTLLRLAAGLRKPTAGEVFLKGTRLDGPSLDSSVVFQADTLLPWRTTLGNVAFGIEAHLPKSVVRARCEDALEAVGLTAAMKLYPHQMSGGMRQRTNLARALATQPEVILMDEPFAALDAQTRDAQQQLLLEIWRRDKRTVLFVTHDIDEAVLLSDIVVTLGSQGIEESMTVDLARPRDWNVRSTERFRELTEKLRFNLYRNTDAAPVD